MLDKFKKLLNGSQPTQQEVTMVEETPQTDLAATELTAQLETALATVASQAAAMKELADKFEALSNQYKEAQTALDAAAAVEATLKAQAQATKLATRKAKIEAAVGTTTSEAVLSATESLPDEQFEVVVGAMAKTFEAEAESVMFTETGVSATATPEEVDPVKKLADKYAAEFNPK